MPDRVATSQGLSPHDYNLVLELQRVSEETDGLDLKLEPSHSHADGHADTALAWNGRSLVGYGGVDFGIDAEACGMVHPQHRRAGLGSALLRAVCDMAAAGGRESMLVICEDRAQLAIEWMQRLGATLAHSELRMLLRPRERHQRGKAGLRLRAAHPADLDAVVAILAEGFNEPPAAVGTIPLIETFVAFDGNRIVGTTRLVHSARRWMIYGFVVDKRFRGKGFGRLMLDAALELLASRGIHEVGLEVDTQNAAGLGLYTSAGFEPVTTYRYMRLSTDVRT